MSSIMYYRKCNHLIIEVIDILTDKYGRIDIIGIAYPLTLLL